MSDPWAAQNAGEQQPPHRPPPPGYGQQPGYGQGPGYGQAPYSRPTSGKATTVLVLGIASLVLMLFCAIGFIPAIIALVMAGGAEREIAESGGALDGAGQIKAGRIMAWMTLGLSALGLLLVIGLFALSIGFA